MLWQTPAWAHLWKTRHSATPACSRRWRTEATRSLSPPSRPFRLLSSRTRCRLWCSHLHRKKKKKTRQGVTICRTVAGDPRTVVLLLHLTGCQLGRAPKKYTGGKKKICLKLFPDDQTLLWKGRRLIGFAPVHVNFRSTQGNSRHLLVLKNLRLLLKNHYGVSISIISSSVFSTFNRERF